MMYKDESETNKSNYDQNTQYNDHRFDECIDAFIKSEDFEEITTIFNFFINETENTGFIPNNINVLIDITLQKAGTHVNHEECLKFLILLVSEAENHTINDNIVEELGSYILFSISSFESEIQLQETLQLFILLHNMEICDTKYMISNDIYAKFSILLVEISEFDNNFTNCKKTLLSIMTKLIIDENLITISRLTAGDQYALDLIHQIKSAVLMMIDYDTATDCIHFFCECIYDIIHGKYFCDKEIIEALAKLSNNETYHVDCMKYLMESVHYLPHDVLQSGILDVDVSSFENLKISAKFIKILFDSFAPEELDCLYHSQLLKSIVSRFNFVCNDVKDEIVGVFARLILNLYGSTDIFAENINEIAEYLCCHLENAPDTHIILLSVRKIMTDVEFNEEMMDSLEDLADDIDNECSDEAFDLLSDIRENFSISN